MSHSTHHRTGRVLTIAAATILAAASAADVRAQTPWDAPMLMAPGASAGWGFHLVDPEFGGLGGLVTWRSAPVPVGIGVRAGLYEGGFDDLALAGGVDFSGTLVERRSDLPVDVIWFAGVGAGIDDDILLSFPAGVSAGWSFTGEDVHLRPWVAPRIVLDALLGDARGGGRGRDDDVDLSAALEIGLDVGFDSGLALRTAVSLGDRDALSIGIVIAPGSR